MISPVSSTVKDVTDPAISISITILVFANRTSWVEFICPLPDTPQFAHTHVNRVLHCGGQHTSVLYVAWLSLQKVYKEQEVSDKQ